MGYVKEESEQEKLYLQCKHENFNIDSITAWNMLNKFKNTFLIDVRTKEEWDNIGYPDLTILNKEVIFLPIFENLPGDVNPNFIQEISNKFKKYDPLELHLLFLCRSGKRSAIAKNLVRNVLGFKYLYNIDDGFEGDGFIGEKEGWKRANLPWRTDES